MCRDNEELMKALKPGLKNLDLVLKDGYFC